MTQKNRETVALYYKRHKKLVIYRKVMKRCREHGAIPTLRSMRVNEIPLTALLVAFADWAGSTGNECKIKKQHKKLTILRTELGPIRKTEFVDPTPDERKALAYLRRFTHPLVDAEATDEAGGEIVL
jgi:hypothetical protein